MIYIVEIPHQNKPKVWQALDENELIEIANKVYGESNVIFEQTTAKEMAGSTIDECDEEWIKELGEKFGWETPLYRADFYNGEGEYTDQTIDEFEACKSAIERDLSSCYFFMSDEEAEAALSEDYLWHGHGKAEAREALKKFLS